MMNYRPSNYYNPFGTQAMYGSGYNTAQYYSPYQSSYRLPAYGYGYNPRIYSALNHYPNYNNLDNGYTLYGQNMYGLAYAGLFGFNGSGNYFPSYYNFRNYSGVSNFTQNYNFRNYANVNSFTQNYNFNPGIRFQGSPSVLDQYQQYYNFNPGIPLTTGRPIWEQFQQYYDYDPLVANFNFSTSYTAGRILNMHPVRQQEAQPFNNIAYA